MNGTEKTDPQEKALFEAILQLRDIGECRRFLSDLCTPAEIRSLSDRWRVARLLAQGVPYRSIYEKTGVSTATVTRVARALTRGEGGYRAVLARARLRMEPGTGEKPEKKGTKNA